MKTFRWSEEKNTLLKNTRKVGFDTLIEEGKYITNIPHPNRENQRILIFEYNNYTYCVPYVEDTDHIFLKTLFANRDYLHLINTF